MKYSVLGAGLLASLLSAQVAHAVTIKVEPYLQTATPTSMWINWETDSNDESIVEWGTTSALGNQATGSAKANNGSSRVHEVQLTGLSSETTYYYRVRTSDAVSGIYQFRTPAQQTEEASTRILAMSDMQVDSSNPNKYNEIIQQGVIPHVTGTLGQPIHEGLSMTLIPGDLVDYGPNYSQWVNTFFAPMDGLAQSVPTYPAPGNHEYNTNYYFNYFHLPENGTSGYAEHWYYFDQSNVRIVSLDTNGGYRIQAQLDWLDGVLEEACDDGNIDFVFAQMHHPYKSEMWLAGETAYSGQLVSRLEQFSTSCDKPTIHFFGHTHAYSRGASRDHKHAMVNVATAGGNIDYFGEFAQADYSEFSVSDDEYGFVMVDVEAGNDPSFEIYRISRGDQYQTLNNVEKDRVKVRRNNMSPDTPEILWPNTATIATACNEFVTTLFSDVDGDAYGATHWQLASDCNSFGSPLVDEWYQHQNIWNGADTLAGMDPNRRALGNLASGEDYCVRVRVRDQGLQWSEWSEAVSFSAQDDAGDVTDNLLVNGGGEDGTTGWTGAIERLSNSSCGSIDQNTGDGFFAVGGVCSGESGYGEAYQDVDVSEHSVEIDSGVAVALYAGALSDYNGQDVPAFRVIFRAADGSELGASNELSSQQNGWVLKSDEAAIPSGTRTIRFELTGTRNYGSDNDSYFDDLSLRVRLAETECPAIESVLPSGSSGGGGTGGGETCTDPVVTVASGNLLQNPGAESGVTGWAGAGPVESLTSGQCDSVPTNSGARFFALGGVCSGESAYGEAYQDVDLSGFQSQIASGTAQLRFGAAMRDYQNKDVPAAFVEFLDANGTVVSTTSTLSRAVNSWGSVESTVSVPAATAAARFVMTGTRKQGRDNDSYIDDTVLELLVEEDPCAE